MWFDASQLSSMPLASIFILSYICLLLISEKNQSSKCLLAAIACQVYAQSPIYNYTIEFNASMVFLVYASIYFTAIQLLTSYKTMIMCFIMALFECVMFLAYKGSLGHAGTEIYLYDNYEYIVTFLHASIIISLVQRSRIRYYYRNIRDSLLRSIISYSRFLHCRG